MNQDSNRALPAAGKDPSLLKTARLDTLMVELTSTCNLRCGYCSKGQPGDELLPGRDEEMRVDLLPQVRRLIDEYRPHEVLAAGTGETTFRKDWIGAVDRLRTPGSRYTLNTNLALDYTDAEFEALARFNALVVSIDSYDRETTRRVRSKSDLRKIAFNMVALRAKLRGRARKPAFVANITLTNFNALHVYETWKFCSELGFDLVSVSDLVEMDYAKTQLGITKWTSLGQNARVELVAQINRAITEAKQGGARFNVQASLRQELQAMMNGQGQGEAHTPAGQTRACTQPWRRVTVAADGIVYPCCVTSPEINMGNVRDPGFSLNNLAFQELRAALLEGRPPPICQGCTNAPNSEVPAFRATIAAINAREAAETAQAPAA